MLIRYNLFIDFSESNINLDQIKDHIRPDLDANDLIANEQSSATDSNNISVYCGLEIYHRNRVVAYPQPSYENSFFTFLRAQTGFLRSQGAVGICLWQWVYYANHCHFRASSPQQSALLARYAIETPVSIVRMSVEELAALH